MSSSDGLSSAGRAVDSGGQLDSYKKKYELLMNSCEEIEQVCLLDGLSFFLLPHNTLKCKNITTTTTAWF